VGRLTAAVLAAVLALAAQRAAAQAPPPGAGVAPRTDTLEEQREARLARQREAVVAQLAAMEKFGQEERFLAALRAVGDAAPQGDEEAAPFRPVKVGRVPLGAFSSFVRWQSPRAGRDRPVAIDLELPNHPFAAIADFDRQLRGRGLDFLLVVLPSRLEIYPELACELAATDGFAGMGAATQRFLLELNRAGVETLSLTGPFVAARFGADPADQLFLRSDPHWTPRGAELAAKVVAEQVARFPWFERGSIVEGRDVRIEPRDFGYDPGPALAKRGAEVEPVSGNTLWTGDKLFDAADESSPITVLGDSNVRLHSMTACDFCTQLCRFTGWKIDAIQAYGGAAEQVRRKLARREPSEWQGKQLVVWVVPETLLVPTEWWKLVPLDAK